MKKILFIIFWCGLCYTVPFFLGKYAGFLDLFMFWGGMAYLGGMHMYNEIFFGE